MKKDTGFSVKLFSDSLNMKIWLSDLDSFTLVKQI
jgi:hypothetical protein